MEITVTQEQGRVPVTIFTLKGDIDANSYTQLQAEAERAHAAGARDLLLDLGGVGFVSTAGIRAINQVFNLLRTGTPEESDEAIHRGLSAGTYKAAHLKLLNPATPVRQALSMAGVDMFIEIFTDRSAALAAF
jgi:anti-anti-sigma factor